MPGSGCIKQPDVYDQMSMQKRTEDLIRHVLLSNIAGFGVVSQNRILGLCGDIKNCFSINADELFYRDDMCAARDRIGKKRLELFINSRNSEEKREQAEAIIEKCVVKDIEIITAVDQRYPDRFKGLPDMPVVIYAKGDLRINSFTRSIGIVGARRCSQGGKQSAITIACEEIQKGSAIISGMAKGIDSYAHTAALKNGGYTIAVLGNGADICYPEEHERLYQEIALKGCILSEYTPGTKAREYRFPQRNRLIAALSDEVYVIDAGSRSGTQTTVEACGRYGRIRLFL